jgi:uncharacterized protein
VNLAEAVLAVGFFTLFALPGLAVPGRRKWVAVIVVAAAIDIFATLAPSFLPVLRIAGAHWNWTGKAIDVAAMLVVCAVLVHTGAFHARDIGLTFRQAPGTMRALVVVILPFLVAVTTLTLKATGNVQPPTLETLAFQATMPGLAEELAYRGVQLALFDRIFARRFRFIGAELGYGAIVVAVVFGLMHGASFSQGTALHISASTTVGAAIIGFVLAWLRERTRSLVGPIVVHNITGLIGVAVPLFR